MRTADRLPPQGVVDARLGTDVLLHLEQGEYTTYRHTYLMPSLTGVYIPTRRPVGMPSSSRARAADVSSTSRAGTSRGGGGLVSPIPPTHHHPGWPDMPTELTGWRFGTLYSIPIEPPMFDHRYVRDPDSPPPPVEYMDEMLGMMATLEGMVLRREAQLSIMGVQMPPVYQPRTGPSRPSRPSRGAGPFRPSRGAGRGESSCRRRVHIVEEEPGEDEEEEEAADRQSETSADREEGSDPGSGSGEEAEEDPEDDSSDSDGAGGAEPVPQKRTKRASYSCS
ncbi:uncharacterized protein LOC114261416 [Camellia sinensis]|uniref:uncharacterized protein LOC114261416 n=1 Tax=Camellia sinensis TaxID=4442 RepID=UPI0010365E8A|nr:uncharacterized protein LOC114261416 [Camellia sinensis]XP_028057490.1 uncharacterized protein LOC114261416 [Camellia sinensis]